MILVSKAKKELIRLIVHKNKRLRLPQTILASFFFGTKTILASAKSLPMPWVKEVDLVADLRCTKCQERVANVISKINDLESIEIHVSEKKVTLTRKSVSKGPSRCPVYNRIAQLSSRS